MVKQQINFKIKCFSLQNVCVCLDYNIGPFHSYICLYVCIVYKQNKQNNH